ncbi:MAG: Cell wall assembly regulator, partial [Thelocarpon impressellum]
QRPQTPVRALGGGGVGAASSSAPPPPPPAQPHGQHSANPLWRQDLMAKQDSQPSGAVQRAYAHPGWIPLARDWGGNNLAVDLAPGPQGKWGQVIIFGRDYDCKYVVARSWAAFLAMVADDLGSEKWFVDEETQELKLREFKTSTVEPGYLDILRWRMDQKHGRKGPRRKPNAPGAGSPQGRRSPSGSPTTSTAEPERGRGVQRLGGAAPAASSPLARVAEESLVAGNGPSRAPPTVAKPEKLVEVATPNVGATADVGRASVEDEVKDEKDGVQGLGVQGLNEKIDDGDGMKVVGL